MKTNSPQEIYKKGFDFRPLVGKKILLYDHSGLSYYEALILNSSESGKVKIQFITVVPLFISHRISWLDLNDAGFSRFELI